MARARGAPISKDHLDDVDALVFDIQDSGMRHYTYISTLLHAMQAAAEHEKHFVVLDRPNRSDGTWKAPWWTPKFKI